MEEEYIEQQKPVLDFSNPPTAYCYDKDTGEYLRTEPCQPDPLESEKAGEAVWLLPADATLTAPPEPETGKAVCWQNGAWTQVEDHRQKRDQGGTPIDGTGTAYWYPEDSWGSPARYMDTVGPLPASAQLTAPDKPVATLFEELRTLRDDKLSQTDYLLMPDYPVSAELLASVKEYRQALRNLPAQDGAPWDGGGPETPWPAEPGIKLK